MFHDLGSTKRERALLAANQSGKTLSAGFEVAMHMTGLYPDWWEGRRFRTANKWWAASTNNESTRDNPQRILLGEKGQIGTGALPKHRIIDHRMARGISDLVDTVKVRHASGGISHLQFKSYEQDRQKWQGESLHGVWYDEEPPLDVYTEGLTRTNARGGITLLTATPLLGMTDVVLRFYPAPRIKDCGLVQMTIDEVGHYTDEERERIIDSYPAYEREARVKGVPMLGKGRVFQVADSVIECEAFAIPDDWAIIGGLDFGWDHPTAAAKIAWDKDQDIIYVTQVYKMSEATPAQHSMTLRRWGDWVPWAWPHDGLQHDKSSGKTLSQSYREEGLRMMRDHATFPDGGYGLEAGVMEMLDRMQTGRLRIFSHLEELFSEIHVYHRDGNGKIVKQGDDLISAVRYAMMMRRFAKSKRFMDTRMPKSVGLTDPFAPSNYNPMDRSFN